ncbi:hypothetical protein BELL_0068g00170 [Botrytis elliptica]|uniref:non-specific serine/threonine protein kinase n=1 Tax=Botrytis elliptica TaxID=278938 RepID=A0A4Z1JWW7_9HELO|nr:hypothetical protein EAE99_004502 [Botrytis elliptica]TGO78391.1 hypothetical protein BELL_0068g00170 [Botrytis elliptica]
MAQPGALAFDTAAVIYIKALRKKNITIRRNKWRADPGFNHDNHNFEGHIATGGFGVVLKVVNSETKKPYALKLQWNLGKFELDLPEGALIPPLTPSSEATKSSSQSVERLSLRAKRDSETRIYLRFIRGGHPHICNLEAFVQYVPEYGYDKPVLGLYFEYCDAGSLTSLAKGFRTHRVKPPELFIWQIFYELVSAVAFLHNEHPDYNTTSQHKGRDVIFQNDMQSGNVFLQWGPDRETGYPHVKIGDFGVAFTQPPGGHVPNLEEYDEPNPEDEDWEPHDRKKKGEVWWLAAVVYELARTGVVLGTLDKDRGKLLNVDPIESHLSGDLDRMLRGTLTADIDQRPFSGELYHRLKGAYEGRVGLMYRRLPDWAGKEVLQHTFDENRMKNLDAGALEVEMAEKENADAIKRIEGEMMEAWIEAHTTDEIEKFDEEGGMAKMEIQFHEQAVKIAEERRVKALAEAGVGARKK